MPSDSRTPLLWRRPALWVFVFLLTLYVLTMSGDFYISDGAVMYRTTEAIVRRGTISVPPDPGLPQIIPGWDGRPYSAYDLGLPLLAIPFYLIGWGVSALFPRWSDPKLTALAVNILPPLATALTGAVLYKLAVELFRKKSIGVGVALLWATGTLAWPYSKVYFSESALALFVVLGLWALVRAGRSGSRWGALAAGLVLGGAVAVRASAVMYLPALWAFVAARPTAPGNGQSRRFGDAVRDLMLISAGVAPAIALLGWHNYYRFHDVLRTGYEGQAFTTPLYAGLYGLLLSPGRSLFLYSPLTTLGLVSLARLWRTHRQVAATVLTAFVVVLLFYSTWWAWAGGWCWGPRFLVPVVPLLILPIGAGLQSRRFRMVTAAVWGLSLLAVIPGMTVDFNAYIVNSIAGDPGRESRLWYVPLESPIIGHWRYLLQGKALFFAAAHLSDYGLPRSLSSVFAPLMGLASLLAAAGMLRAAKQPGVSGDRAPGGAECSSVGG